MKKLPAFDELPVRDDAPAESSWGVFENEALGCLNFLSPEGVVDAARLVTSGKVFRLDARIGLVDPPLFGRAAVMHKVVPLGPTVNDDILDRFNTQEGSQWDGLAHVGHFRHRAFYNGVRVEEVRDGRNERLGIHHWAAKFVGRGVLVDLWRSRRSQGSIFDPLEKDAFTVDELERALEAQGTELAPGSILLIRTGWLEAYERCPAERKAAMVSFENVTSVGLEPSRETVAWLWDHRVAAVAADCPAVEPMPFDRADEGALHYRTLPLLGLPLGELFVLAPLATDCAEDGRYEFMLVSAPLHLRGGIASPPNAVAIK
ncbi:MAG TPA: cyclase family protein [Gammaproteobacteria bacterium]|nr:cyclase family protein [Gammaproteobacteria bacterium]